MDVFLDIVAVAVISLLGSITPGPDFCIVLKNSLSHSRKAGFFTALGISLSLIIHLFYTLLGIGIIIAENPLVYAITKWTGAAYLFYIGLSSVVSSFKAPSSLDLKQFQSLGQMSSSKALLQGFLTNLLNPEVAIFFISLFSQFIDASTPHALKTIYVLINWFIALGWYLALSYLVTIEGFIKKIQHSQIYIDRIMGGSFLFLSVKLLFI
jgi:threonine/homoserine/homoserine lactone efflux protein